MKLKEVESKWYMVQCATNKEEQAIKNLKFELESNNLQGYVEEISSPRETHYFMRNGKKVQRDKVMFPGYILMKMKLYGELPRVIKQTQLISKIAGDSGKPTALKEHEVNRIFGNVEKSQREIEYLKDEEVSIIDGPFKGFKAVVTSVDKEKDRVRLDVTVFGRATPIELNFGQIDKI